MHHAEAREREGDAQILNRVGIEMGSGSKNNGRAIDGLMHGNGANPVKVEPRKEENCPPRDIEVDSCHASKERMSDVRRPPGATYFRRDAI